MVTQRRSQTSATRNQHRLLERCYTNAQQSPAAYTSVQPLLRAARRDDPRITRESVEKFLHGRQAYTRHRRAVHRFARLPTLAAGLHTDWQADLADLQQLRRANRGYGYLLVCVDVLSRQLFVEPMRRKQASDSAQAFSAIFKRAGVLPWRIYTDQGREFTAGSVQQLFQQRQILHRLMLTSPQFHAAMVERAIRTIKERLWRYFTDRRTHNWLAVIQDIVAGINATPHSSLPEGLAPREVCFANSQQVRHVLWQRAGLNPSVEIRRAEAPRGRTRFQLNDHVRIEKQKNPFEKGYLPRFSTELFTVIRVRRGDRRLAPRLPVTYALADHQGKPVPGWFYQQQLSRATV